MDRVTSAAPQRIALLGFGLIGGSIAHALAAARGATPLSRERPTVVAWSPSGRGPARAAAECVIDGAATSIAAALTGADLVIVATPPIETIALVVRLATDLHPALASGAVVTDVGSTKAAIVGAATGGGLRFVGGHPMAGREHSGYEAATAELFRDRPWVIVPPNPPDPAALGLVRWLAITCGAHPVELAAPEHDAAVAAVSHLPLIASAALVEAVAGAPDAGSWERARPLAASGWASMTRLARGDVHMGAGIAATNAAAIAADLRRYRGVLDAWIAALEDPSGPDAAALERRLASARALLVDGDSGTLAQNGADPAR